ncbi:hypothetical protein D3C72_1316980 [compost metagenome]
MQPQAHVVHLDDRRHQPVDANGHADADDRERDGFGHQRRRRHGAEGHRDDLRGEDGVGADRPPDLLVLQLQKRVGAVLDGLEHVPVVLVVLGAVLVHHLVDGLVAQEGAAGHQQGRDGDGGQGQGQGDQDRLVDERAQRDLADDGQLPRRVDADHDVGVDRQVVADDARGFLGGELRHRRHVVQNHGDVVEKREEPAGGHR